MGCEHGPVVSADCQSLHAALRQGAQTEIFGVSVGADCADVFRMPSDFHGAPRPKEFLFAREMTALIRVPPTTQRPIGLRLLRARSFSGSTRSSADPELTPLAFKLAYVLANLVNERQGCAWPSVAHLASKCRVTENGVKKVVRQLSERGHLSVEFGSGRGKTNRYRWILNGANTGGVSDSRHERSITSRDRMEQPALPFSAEKGATAVHPMDAKRGNSGSEKRGNWRCRKGQRPLPRPYLKINL